VSAIAYENGIETLKSRLHWTWTAGDYAHFSRYLESDAVAFYQRLAAPPGSTLLDVACGSGQIALLAARDGVGATGADIAENLISVQTHARPQNDCLRVFRLLMRRNSIFAMAASTSS
jgi:2-polyprenyl-3-methyl-5-hydroxy-6-metoxy-1,4-benzoquinol methylase